MSSAIAIAPIPHHLGRMLRTAEHLRAFLKSLGWSFARADQAANVPAGRTASYLRAKNAAKPSAEYLDALVAAAGLSRSWKELDPGILPKISLVRENPTTYSSTPGMDPPNPIGMKGMVPGAGRRQFPVWGITGAAAAPVESADRDPDDWEDFPDDLYRPERFATRVVGDSMAPRLEHGDYVLVQPHPSPPSGLLVVAKNASHEHIVKLLRRDDEKGVTLEPLNVGYEVIEPDGTWSIVGYVVCIKRRGGRGRGFEEWDDAGMRP